MASDALVIQTEWDRNLAKRLRSVGISDVAARDVAARIRHWGHYYSVVRRRALARPWNGRNGAALLESAGYVDATEALACRSRACAKVLQDAAEALVKEGPDPKKGVKSFLVEMLTPEMLRDLPEILDFILCDEILEYAIGYFQSIPILQVIAFSWTPANEDLRKSQRFHTDNEDMRLLKFSLNVTDVAPENGPFTLIPAPKSDEIIAAWREQTPDYLQGHRIPDEFVEMVLPRDRWIEATGPAGTIVGVDTCRCLHFGARTRAGYRVTLRFSFSRLDCARMSRMALPKEQVDRYRDDPLRRLVLNL